MQNKSKLNTILLVIIIILLAGGLVYIISNNSKQKDNNLVNNLPQEEKQITDTHNNNNLITESFNIGSPEYLKLLTAVKKFDSTAGDLKPISVDKKIDITGDGIAEFLVSTGNGGATMDIYTVVKYEKQDPEVVTIIDTTGKTGDARPGYYSAGIGGGGSGRYGSNIELLSGDKSILTKVYSIYGQPEDYCYSVVYTWNEKMKLFEYNTDLSKKYSDDLITFCKKLASDTGVNFIDKN